MMTWMEKGKEDQAHWDKVCLLPTVCVHTVIFDAVPYLPGGVGMSNVPSFWCSCQALLLVQNLSCVLHTVTTGLKTRLVAIRPVARGISCAIPCEGAHLDSGAA